MTIMITTNDDHIATMQQKQIAYKGLLENYCKNMFVSQSCLFPHTPGRNLDNKIFIFPIGRKGIFFVT